MLFMRDNLQHSTTKATHFLADLSNRLCVELICLPRFLDDHKANLLTSLKYVAFQMGTFSVPSWKMCAKGIPFLCCLARIKAEDTNYAWNTFQQHSIFWVLKICPRQTCFLNAQKLCWHTCPHTNHRTRLVKERPANYLMFLVLIVEGELALEY